MLPQLRSPAPESTLLRLPGRPLGRKTHGFQEVDGAYLSHGGTRLPGDTSPTVGECLDNFTGGQSRVRGVSLEVGESQTAADLTVNVTYGKPIHEVTEAVRRNVIRRVESLTGLVVTEVNITVNDVTFEE